LPLVHKTLPQSTADRQENPALNKLRFLRIFGPFQRICTSAVFGDTASSGTSGCRTSACLSVRNGRDHQKPGADRRRRARRCPANSVLAQLRLRIIVRTGVRQHRCRLMGVAPILAPHTAKPNTNSNVPSMYSLHVGRAYGLLDTLASDAGPVGF
jgi:hypothetical protein